MRIAVACVVIVFTVLLALPEITGAPTGCNSDDVVSEKVEKKSSKNSEKLAEEEKEQKCTRSKARNGLVSGSKSISMSRELTDTDEEQSNVNQEKVTNSGSEKSTESNNKKKLVSVKEKKTVLIYYMVSYKKLPSKHECETKVEYYKRIFPKEDNLMVFYRKIFKSYEKEEPKSYIERIEYILEIVYPELDCRLDVKWLDQFDHYYTLKYSRKIDEPDEHYFPRVLVKMTGETNEHYKKRMECLVAALDEEDFTHITFDDSECGYKIGIRKTPAKTKSSPSSSGLRPTNQMTSSTKKSKREEVDVDQSESEVVEKNNQGTTSETEKKQKKQKTSVEKEENIKTFEYRVAYTKLPKKTPGELDSVYYKRFFGEYCPNMDVNERNEMYLRILIHYKGENMTDYIQRIDYLFDKVYPEIDIRTNFYVITLLEHYYKVKYEKKTCETDKQWFARVLTKLPGETVKHFKERVLCLQSTITEVDWKLVKIDENSTTGYKYIGKCSS